MEKIGKLISVIIPVYNVEKYLERCMESVLKQTYSNIEVILIDDGSTDKSSNICDRYKEDNRVIVVHQKNGGSSSARNAGLTIMHGEYCCFVDADDVVAKDYIEKMYNAINANDVDCVICSYYKEWPDGKECVMDSPFEGAIDRETALCAIYSYNGFAAYNWNKLFKTDIIKKYNIFFDLELRMTQDLLWVTQYFQAISKSAVVKEPLYHYMYNKDSICRTNKTSQTFNPKFLTSLLAHERTWELLKNESDKVKKSFKGRYVNTYLRLILNLAYANYPDEALLQLAKKNIRKNILIFITRPSYGIKQKLGGTLAAIHPKLFVFVYELMNKAGNIEN